MLASQPAPNRYRLVDDLVNEPHTGAQMVVALAAMIYLRWVDFQEAEAEAMAAFDDTEYLPVLRASLHWRRWCELPPAELHDFFNDSLAPGIEKIGHPGQPWAQMLQRILPAIHSLCQLSPKASEILIQWLAEHPFETPSDRRQLLELFDGFLDRASAREFGQFRTPPDIAELMVALADPAAGQRVYDPCFGSGGILAATWQAFQKASKQKLARPAEASLEIAGVEINSTAFAIALARLVLVGVPNPLLELGNSLEREGVTNPDKEGFDLVISNPPWGTKIEPHGTQHFPIPTNDGTSLFIQHAVLQLRPSGRAVLIVPQGFLFQGGRTAAVRQWLMEHHRVEAVIGLPGRIFLPYSAAEPAILIIQRDGGPTKSIRMMDGAGYFEPQQDSLPVGIFTHQITALKNALVLSGGSESAWDVSAETLAEMDFDLSPKRREISSLDQTLDNLDVPVLPLKELCQIVSGRSAKSADLSNAPLGDNFLPYIRVGDIQRGQTMKCKSWLSEEASADFGPRHRLRAGDVLLSKAGTIGKAGIVRNGGVGGIASGTLFVLTHHSSQIDPNFLTAYLMSKDCQDWLQSRSSGSVISGLRKQFVEELKVPVPPLPIQERIATDVRNHGVDALTQLVQLLTQDESDPIANWVDRSLKALAADTAQDSEDPSAIVRLQIFREFHEALVSVFVNEEEPSSPLMVWADSLKPVRELFDGSSNVPPCPALLSMLQSGTEKLRLSAGKLGGHSPTESKARELTVGCAARLEAAIAKLLQEVKIHLSPQTSSLIAGESQDVPFLVKNEGPLPLRSFTIDPGSLLMGWGESKFLPERSQQVQRVEIKVPESPGLHNVTVEWEGNALDGREVRGSEKFTFEVVTQSPIDAEISDLGSSPYFISEPVGPSRRDIFIGREEILHRIKNQLESGNTVLLEGNRRAGKTSILKQLEGFDAIPSRLAVYSSMQAAEGNSTLTGMTSEAVWRTLAKSLASGLCALQCDVPLPDGSVLPGGKGLGIAKACRSGISSDAPWEDFLEYAGLITSLLAERGRGLVLMIDEFDKLQEGIDNGITSPQIPENIRYLIQNLPGFSAILTGSRRMQRLRHEYWSALYGLGARIGVTALDPDAARRLVRQPVEGRLNYSDDAVALLIDLCARQPFLIQSLANLVFESMVKSGGRSATVSTVEAAANHFVEHNEHFNSLLDYTESDQRRFLTLLVHRASKDPDPVTFGNLQDRLLREQIEVPDETLTQDLRFLMDLELIDYHGTAGGIYSLTVPLMGRWLDFQHDYQALLAKARAEQGNQL